MYNIFQASFCKVFFVFFGFLVSVKDRDGTWETTLSFTTERLVCDRSMDLIYFPQLDQKITLFVFILTVN